MITRKHGTLWTAEEDHLLRTLAATLTKPELSDVVGRTVGAIEARAKGLCVHFPKRPAPDKWQPHEDDMLRRCALECLTVRKAAARIGRSRFATATHALRIGVSFAAARRRSAWSDEELATAKLMWPSCTGDEIATKLGRGLTRQAVIGMMRRQGLKKRKPVTRPTEAVKRRMRPIGTPKRPKPFSLPSYNPAARAIVKKAAQALPAIAANDTPHVALEDLEYWHCRWIAGDPQKIPRTAPLYCGHKRQRGLAYCAEHSRRAYRPVH
jgi:GcrA cell cycle regulator